MNRIGYAPATNTPHTFEPLRENVDGTGKIVSDQICGYSDGATRTNYQLQPNTCLRAPSDKIHEGAKA